MAGSLQKTGATKPLPAKSFSNFARGAEREPGGGSVGEVGYTKVAYPMNGPAISASDIKNSVDSYASLGNDGTSRGSYVNQPGLLSADNPVVPTMNKGAK
jgi:hypothetical protein